MAMRKADQPEQIVMQESYLARVIGRVKSVTKSPPATYAGGGATAGAVVGTLLLGPLRAALGGALGGGIGGYLGAKREEREQRERLI